LEVGTIRAMMGNSMGFGSGTYEKKRRMLYIKK
jgi:hypothetical protein